MPFDFMSVFATNGCMFVVSVVRRYRYFTTNYVILFLYAKLMAFCDILGRVNWVVGTQERRGNTMRQVKNPRIT